MAAAVSQRSQGKDMNELLCAVVGFVMGYCCKGLAGDAWAFLADPDARAKSPFTYPSGAPMSVRDAKKSGLM
jgi:hypothetical protein